MTRTAIDGPARTDGSPGPAGRLGAATAALCALLAVALPAWSHAVVHPSEAPPGAYQKYVLRVPTERDVPTTRVELAFPPEVQALSFADVPGWDLEVRRDGAGRIVGAAWTGELPPSRFVEFPFVAVNPRTETRLRWAAVQTYAGGETVRWAGPEGSETPASFTVVRAAADPAGGPPGGIALLALAGGALVVSLLSLGLVLRRSG